MADRIYFDGDRTLDVAFIDPGVRTEGFIRVNGVNGKSYNVNLARINFIGPVPESIQPPPRRE